MERCSLGWRRIEDSKAVAYLCSTANNTRHETSCRTLDGPTPYPGFIDGVVLKAHCGRLLEGKRTKVDLVTAHDTYDTDNGVATRVIG